MEAALREDVSVVAILKNEDPFVEEWIAYHRLLGVSHFYLYDNDPNQPLSRLLFPYAGFVTVIPWVQDLSHLPGRNIQTKAYVDSLARVKTRWVAFIDGDEFIALKKHATIEAFLQIYSDAGAVVIAWHIFGHNGHYSNPRGLVTEALVRRRRAPGKRFKAINRTTAIAAIESVHSCILKPGYTTIDPNGRDFSPDLYPSISELASINHYMCRSFEAWMGRVRRGSTHYNLENSPPGAAWQFTQEGCLRKFVENAAEWNELVDEGMKIHSQSIKALIARARSSSSGS